jgi:hypothetical protein
MYIDISVIIHVYSIMLWNMYTDISAFSQTHLSIIDTERVHMFQDRNRPLQRTETRFTCVTWGQSAGSLRASHGNRRQTRTRALLPLQSDRGCQSPVSVNFRASAVTSTLWSLDTLSSACHVLPWKQADTTETCRRILYSIRQSDQSLDTGIYD